MSKFKVSVRMSGSNARGAYIVPRSLPIDLAAQLADIADLSDFASLVKADGSVVTAAPTQGSQIEVLDVNICRFHRSEGEGKERTYSPTPSFSLEFVVA